LHRRPAPLGDDCQAIAADIRRARTRRLDHPPRPSQALNAPNDASAEPERAIGAFLDRWTIPTILKLGAGEYASMRSRKRVKSQKDTLKKRLYKTNEVCDLFDISRATLFRWERQGLISGPPRDWRNWRLYTADNVEQIRQVMQGRKEVA
jgi:MerR HTH family regulatory protein